MFPAARGLQSVVTERDIFGRAGDATLRVNAALWRRIEAEPELRHEAIQSLAERAPNFLAQSRRPKFSDDLFCLR
jgi:hypothetical protein